ncbi:hypothetical protein A8V01_27360 [Novosphingobium guangzhouense]|uniref:Uncharacterized protein n=1 Tax=Novosphingobium guangzhouense TaxID=1850347 RepID=A0A2K2FS90_9SPHN|nr:hypothetical protein A8V01_27360 [Novosphingobium guangzhouense]
MRIGLFAIGITLLLIGCDRLNGVQSHSSMRGPVEISCVNAALGSIPEAGHFVYQTDQHNSVEILPKQRKTRTITHVWTYGEARSYILQINQTADGWDYTNTLSRIGEAISQAEIDRFIPTMRKVNRAIQNKCGLQVADLQAQPIS